MINPILLSFIISATITFIYYYIYISNDKSENKKETNMSNCFSVFLISFIFLYLLFIFYLNNNIDINESIDKIDTNIRSYKAPF